MTTYKVIGIMSGTSLDGVDIAYCEFKNVDKTWEFIIKNAETFPYPAEWQKWLAGASEKSGLELAFLNNRLGKYFGELAINFIRKNNLTSDFISSHGHTIFHQPSKGLTLQIGSGAEIAAQTRLLTVCDFRTLDVALGGQGAPLVPVGDRLLFADFRFCLNLGGFANISFDQDNCRMAFDVCPVNTVLNFLANQINLDFDKDGLVASSGKIDENLLNQLNEIAFYAQNPPKSLGREWLETCLLPIVSKNPINIPDKLRTVTEHVAIQIGNVLKNQPAGKLLITGGGALNRFLVHSIANHTIQQIVIPDPLIINFKEALIFAFLGVLRLNNTPNCLSSVTGAACENVGGAVYFGGKSQ